MKKCPFSHYHPDQLFEHSNLTREKKTHQDSSAIETRKMYDVKPHTVIFSDSVTQIENARNPCVLTTLFTDINISQILFHLACPVSALFFFQGLLPGRNFFLPFRNIISQ